MDGSSLEDAALKKHQNTASPALLDTGYGDCNHLYHQSVSDVKGSIHHIILQNGYGTSTPRSQGLRLKMRLMSSYVQNPAGYRTTTR